MATSCSRRCRRSHTALQRAARAVPCAVLAIGAIVVAAQPVSTQAADATSTTAYRPLTPCRLLDTRDADQAKTGAGGSLMLVVRGRCGVSDDAAAVAVTVTVTEAAGDGFITAWPSGQQMPVASTNNYSVGETRANGALLSLGADGNLSLFTSNSVHIIVDVSGEFYPATTATGGRYVPIPPARVLDTRDGGGPALSANASVTVALPSGVPPDATAMAVILTITGSRDAGFLSAYPQGTPRPLVSSLNTDAGRQTRTASQIVPVSSSGLTVFSNAGGHIIVDVVGYFSGPSAAAGTTGLFIPAMPVRILDTRDSVQIYPGGAVLAATSGVAAAAGAVAANITVAESGPPGYVTAWAAQTEQPGTPVVSYDSRGQTVADMSIVSVSTAGIAVASTSGAQVVVDITGWFTGSPLPPSTDVPPNQGPAHLDPTGPVGCLQSIPAPSADGVYQIEFGYQLTVHTFTAGRNGPIVVIGDSLTLGSAAQTARALRTAGWGPICIDGTIARSIEFGSPWVPDGLDAVNRIRTSHPIWNDPTITWVIALGTNDVVFSGTSGARAKLYVADQIAAIGPNPIWWVNVRTSRIEWQYQEAIFNQSIAASGVNVIDWYSASGGQGWIGGDLIHLTSVGYQARADLVARTVHPN